MPTINNKTHRALSVPLPRGKTLHLGPGQTGQITAKAAANPQLLKLAEVGEIEIVGADSRPAAGPRGPKKGRAAAHGYGSGGAIRRSGDR